MDIHDCNEVYVQAAAHWRDVAEKSQIQALNQFQPVLPTTGTPERHSPDYVRPGTTSLLAELDVASGKVIGSLRQRRRAQEFKEFLVEIDTEVPADLDVHLILDNYATHKAPEIRRWLLRHPRFHLHFMPTSDSWLNMVERWFADITTRRSSVELIRASKHSRRTSRSSAGMTSLIPTSGSRPPTRSSLHSPGTRSSYAGSFPAKGQTATVARAICATCKVQRSVSTMPGATATRWVFGAGRRSANGDTMERWRRDSVLSAVVRMRSRNCPKQQKTTRTRIPSQGLITLVQGVYLTPFQGGNTGSNPVGGAD